MRLLSIAVALCYMWGLVQAAPSAKFPQVECGNPNRFTKVQRDHIIYAYNFGAPKGMGYTMAAIAWQESCAGAYMVNFSDPSAGLYHAHIPVVLKYYSSYNDTPFTRNIMGQLLIDDKRFASQVALDSLMYWHRYHKGNYKNIIKSYSKGFKWQKDHQSNKLAESYYLSISKKLRALESYIPKYTRVKNQNTLIDTQNKPTTTANGRTQSAKSPTKSTPTKPRAQPNPNPTPKSSSVKKQDEFVDLPLEGDARTQGSAPNYDDNFEDFTLIFEGNL